MTRRCRAEGLDMCLQTTLPVLQACTTTMVSSDLRADVRRVAVPTLVIHGDADASAPLPVTGQPTAALLPDARLCVYPDGPHGLYVTPAERLSEDLLRFATTHELPAPEARDSAAWCGGRTTDTAAIGRQVAAV